MVGHVVPTPELPEVEGLVSRRPSGLRTVGVPSWSYLWLKDGERVRQAVKQHRQRISLAKAELGDSLGKEFSQRTLVRFLKNLTADTNA